MANRYAGLDPTWAHLPAPAPTHTTHAAAGHCHSWLFPAAAFENEALTCALRASMSPANAASSTSYPTTPSSSSTSSASELPAGGHDAPASRTVPPARAAALMGTKAGRVTKRKLRPSRRPPPTYIVADPANFRRMVQEVTGFPVASSGVRPQDAGASEPASAAAPSWPTPPACMLPTLDTSAFLLDCAVAAPARGSDDKSSSGGASSAMAVTAAAAAVEDDVDSSVFQELEAMACAPAFVSDDFPTLESWGII